MKNTISYLTDPYLSQLYWPSVVTGLAIALFCALLSILVVLKRLAFIGQGISHAAFGGVGLAAIAGLASGAASQTATGLATQFGVIFGFCLVAALTIGHMSEKKTGKQSLEPDTAIGIVLVASMGVGALLIKESKTTQAWDSFLFGSIVGLYWADAIVAWGVAAAIALALFLARRPLAFWAFDTHVAEASGVRGRAMNFLLLSLLALATVTAMKLAGVVLATAMLVLPGAVALRVSRRSVGVGLAAVVVAVVGVCGGLVLSFEMDWLPGPSIVLVLVGLFALTPLLARKA